MYNMHDIVHTHTHRKILLLLTILYINRYIEMISGQIEINAQYILSDAAKRYIRCSDFVT